MSDDKVTPRANELVTPEEKAEVIKREKARHGQSATVHVGDRRDANGQIQVRTTKITEKEGVDPPKRRA